MAKKSTKATSKPSASDENVVRIKAGSSTPKKNETKKEKTRDAATTASVSAKPVKEKRAKRKGRGTGVFKAIGGYFKGAWVELRQVRWPNRRATWSLTGAVLIYSAFFVVLVLLLDAGFKYLFELILGK